MTQPDIKALIVEDFFTQGLSYSALAKKYDRHETTCRKIIRQYQLRQPQKRSREIIPSSRRPRTNNGKPLSLAHSAVGMRIARHMQRTGVSATTFGNQLSPVKGPTAINEAIVGTYDWSLTELLSLADFFGVSLDKLVNMEPLNASA